MGAKKEPVAVIELSPQRLIEIKELFDERVVLYERPEFISDDPIQVVHEFAQEVDKEIAGLLSAMMAWGQRVTAIKKTRELLNLMDWHPSAWIIEASAREWNTLDSFKHRTLNGIDIKHILGRVGEGIKQYGSLETLMIAEAKRYPNEERMHSLLQGLHGWIFPISDGERAFPQRTIKHLSNPSTGSACKRLNMYMRWMVRSPEAGVDLGLWKEIRPSELMIPLDVHSGKEAVAQGLLPNKISWNWKDVQALTQILRQMDAEDPAKYDFALYGYRTYAGIK